MPISLFLSLSRAVDNKVDYQLHAIEFLRYTYPEVGYKKRLHIHA